MQIKSLFGAGWPKNKTSNCSLAGHGWLGCGSKSLDSGMVKLQAGYYRCRFIHTPQVDFSTKQLSQHLPSMPYLQRST